MKQFNMAAIPLLCAAVSPLCADAQGSQTMNKQQSDQMMMNQVTPSAEPKVTRWADPYITADFIWWKAKEDGLEYAFNGASRGTNGVSASRGSTQHPSFEYEPGFKVGAGLKFRHDGWDLYAQYTWLRVDKSDSRSSVSSAADGSSDVVSNMFVNIPNGTSSFLQTFNMASAQGEWSLHFNVLDLELGRNFWISKCLTLRPYVGMKFSWNDQDLDVNYNQPNLQGVPTADNPSAVKLAMDLDQSAIGLRTGLDTAWYMWKKWCIFGELAVSGMWNDIDSTRKDTAIKQDGTALIASNVKRTSHTVSAVLEWALGLRFETAFHNDDFDFMLQAGWEEQIWFNQNQFVMMPNQTPADLNFEGLTIKAAFYF